MRLFCFVVVLIVTLNVASARRRRSQQCKEEKLEQQEELANMVFTGTVERLYRARSDVYRGVVRVKRVLKGDSSFADHSVIVEGFGDPHICYSDVRERDTRIFMVNQLENSRWRLNSSVVRVSVTNLDRAAAATQGLPFKKKKAPSESHCEKMYCAYGAQCLVDQRTQLAHCRCQETCIDVFAPVCGNDGVSYSSDCQLRMASCTRQKRIFTKHQGPCEFGDPCEETDCHFGAQCLPSLDGRTAECVCPKKCATYGDTRGFRPVCGTDGHDYPNVCELRRTSCIEMREIDVRYKGKCNPCQEVKCPTYQVCQLDENRHPHCRCNDVCNADYRPVCGSDGETYINECVLRVESCKTQRNLRVIYSGECSSGANPCELIKCGPGQECDIDRYGVAFCQCPSPCEPIMKPVCGSNGRTFDNECELKRQSCLLRQELTLIHKGECGERGPCHRHRCSYGAMCVVKSGQPVCECPTCAEEFDPVCGTDGISYTNTCKMKREACQQKTEIELAYNGLCNGCDSQQCDFYGICEKDSRGRARCVCPQVCIKVEAPVCGTDGLTYQNECELRVEACKKQQYIALATKGPCDQCEHVNCKHGSRCENGRCVCPTHCPDTIEVVCATDGKTYGSECEMRTAACQRRVDLSVRFFGHCEEALIFEEHLHTKKQEDENVTSCQDKECKFGGECDHNEEGKPYCLCKFYCPAIREPACGTDGKLHENECRLREEACVQQKRISPVPREVCAAQVDIPCDGEPALIDPSTEQEYFCGEGMGATLCPPRSYCHKTKYFAKCCRERPLIRSCRDTPFGCCPDRRTPVLGPNSGGCPSVCNCNTLGSFSLTCDPVTKQCPCKPGVGGLRCDRCEPGYWGLHMISKGNSGCSYCNCNRYGSLRDDCEQMTGRCICKHGIQGMKCDICPTGTALGPDGCVDASAVKISADTCDDLQCYHGAKCVEIRNRAKCSCDLTCSPEDSKDSACGSDGNTYGSECQMKLFSCRYQRPISVKHYGPCRTRGDVEPTTVEPPKRSSRRRAQTRRLDKKATREISPILPQNLFLMTGKTFPNSTTTDSPFLALPPELPAEVNIPSFSAHSYLELHKLDAYTKLSLELEFTTFANDGIILYNGQTSTGHGDFVSLSVKNGFIEFRYNLGSGAVILRSPQPINPGKYYTVSAKRYLRDGMLSVEGMEKVSGRSQGLLNALDLNDNLYLGFVPDASKSTISNIGIGVGLMGCIRRLKIDRREVNLKYPSSREITDGSHIRECKDSLCSNMPCNNGGTCLTSEKTYKCVCNQNFTGDQCETSISPCSDNPCGEGSTCALMPQGGFTCKCPPGKSGKLCDKVNHGLAKIYVPDFSNHSYLEMGTMQNVGQAFSIEVWFLARDLNGVILYNGQMLNGKGDFISINLVKGYVQFRYNLGSGIANITSTEPVELGKWHAVKVSRLRRQGSLKLNNGTAVIGKSKAPLTELNLDQPLYIGGYPNQQMLHHESGVTKGLDGAIQRIALNGEVWDHIASRAIRSHGVKRYRGLPCYPGSCLHGAICFPHLNEFHCKCAVKYSGKKCEKRIRRREKRKAVYFNETTFLSFPFKNPKGSRSRKSNRIRIRFRTSTSSGLLLWTNKGRNLEGDYLSIAVVDGYPELSYNLGKQVHHWSIRSDTKIDDNSWHTVTVRRKKRLGEIQVDKGLAVSNVSEPGATDLNTDGTLWIGGMPKLPEGLPKEYYEGFIGCIDLIVVDSNPMHLLMQQYPDLQYCEHSRRRKLSKQHTNIFNSSAIS